MFFNILGGLMIVLLPNPPKINSIIEPTSTPKDLNITPKDQINNYKSPKSEIN